MSSPSPRSVLVLNCGSSSVKFDWFEMPGGANPLRGRVERVGSAGAVLFVEGPAVMDGAPVVGGAAGAGGASGPWSSPRLRSGQALALAPGFSPVVANSAAEAVRAVLLAVQDRMGTPDAIGHRVVHGGEAFVSATVVDDKVIAGIEAVSGLAPLHNPANLEGIRAARAAFPSVPNVAVFDTAFHATLPEEAYLYALPRELHRTHGFRRYGFHGSSHAYVARKAAEFLGKPIESLRFVSLHLGNGCSATAIRSGRSVDTSMGLTPLEGLVMGTRAGDVDAAIVLRLAREKGVEATEALLNKESGLLGLSQLSNDLRDLEKAAGDGHPGAALAIRTMARRITQYVGAYAAVMGGIDALLFTGGIGEHSSLVRRLVTEGLEFLGIVIDPALNAVRAEGVRSISPTGTRVPVLVVPTDEELEIARETVEALRG